MKKLVPQQQAAKGALDVFVSVLRVARANPCTRELPRVTRQIRSHTRATRRTKPAVGAQLGLVAVGRRISRTHSEEYTPASPAPQSRARCHLVATETSSTRVSAEPDGTGQGS